MGSSRRTPTPTTVFEAVVRFFEDGDEIADSLVRTGHDTSVDDLFILHEPQAK